MSCPCESYEFLIVDLCDDPLTLWELVADETGTWTAEIEFNGMVKCALTVPVEMGMPVQIPNRLNENYLHEARFFREDGTLIGCFWIGGKQYIKKFPCHRIIDEAGNPILSETSLQIITDA